MRRKSGQKGMARARGGGQEYTAVRVKVSSEADVRVKCRRKRRKSAKAHPVKVPIKRFQQKFPAMFALREGRLPMPPA